MAKSESAGRVEHAPQGAVARPVAGAHQSLYRKYRSQTFGDLVGQDATSRALQGAIVSGRVSHAYLFSGSRGTGKTSAARLLAKSLNCTGRSINTAEPCNACQSCLEVTAGAALDLIEIDAASNRGIDEIRDLREKVNLAPALGRYKVYIIDEAHMLTEPAFNALLKTLEEPPPHVVFVLCTTDAQKVPLTVIGRCQQFVFRRHSEEQITSRLNHIAGAEGLTVEADALRLIARTAQGSMRDAVGLLDQLVPLAEGPISIESARSLLGIADPQLLDSLLDLVLAGRAADALGELGRIYDAGAELRQVVRGLMEGCRDRLLGALEAQNQGLARRLSNVLDALLRLDGEVRRHAEPRFLVEATLTRLAVEAEAPAASNVARPAAEPRKDGSDGRDHVDASPADDDQKRLVEPPAATLVDSISGWTIVLDKLNRTVRAVYLDAQPEISGSTLVLWFRYAFHHKKAQEQSDQLIPHVRAWLGEKVSLEFRLREQEPKRAGSAAPSPEDDPFVREVVRRFDGRVTRVKEADR